MPDFKPMLAKDADLGKLTFPLIVQPKLDGIRAVVKDGKLLSRTLKRIPNVEIRAALEKPEFEGFDGELIVGDPTDEKCYNGSVSFVMSESKTGQPWSYFAFDLHDHPGSFTDRHAALVDRVKRIDWTSLPVFTVATVTASDAAELERMESLMVDAGHEGVIARVPSSRYKFGRSGRTGPLLKIKRFVDFEAEVVGIYEENHNANAAHTNALGRTERSSHQAGKVGKGTLGGLVLRALNGPFAGVEFRCGTGFDAHQRAELWAEHHSGLRGTTLHGRIAKIKFFPIGSKDKPRHPVFLGWRAAEDMS